MGLHDWSRSTIEEAFKAALALPVAQDGNTDAEDAREFREFIESISVSEEEMEALVSMPELTSIHAARQYLQEGHASPMKNPSPLGRAASKTASGQRPPSWLRRA